MAVTRETRFAPDVNCSSFFGARERSGENWFFSTSSMGEYHACRQTATYARIANRNVIFAHNSRLLTSRRHFSWGPAILNSFPPIESATFFFYFSPLPSFFAALLRCFLLFFSFPSSLLFSFLLPSFMRSRMLLPLYIFAHTHTPIRTYSQAACKYANHVHADTHTHTKCYWLL